MLTKSIVVLVGLSAVYPAVIGFWACMKTFQLIPIQNLESSNREEAMIAAQNIGNTGMAITYIWQLKEFVAPPIIYMFKRDYNRLVCLKIEEHYRKLLEEGEVFFDTKYIIIEYANEQLVNYGGLPILPDVNIDEIQKETIQQMEFCHLAKAMVVQITEDVKTVSCKSLIQNGMATFCVMSLLGFCHIVLAAGIYGVYQPFTLQSPFDLASSDTKKVEDAVANYVNVGHGLEYIATMFILSYVALNLLLGKQYRQVMRAKICKAYDVQLQGPSLSSAEKKLLQMRKEIQLKHYL